MKQGGFIILNKKFISANKSNYEFGNMPIIDCHTHITNGFYSIRELTDIMKICNLKALNVLSLTADKENPVDNLLCLLLKAMDPGRIYSFGGLHYPAEGIYDRSQFDFMKYAKKLIDKGFDGMKMIEGKPNVRKRTGEPLDSTVYDEYYAYLEEQKIPVIFHVADPDDLWYKDRLPLYAVKNDWFYGDSTYSKKETIFKEAEGILKKFPALKIIFAHFGFMSTDIAKASEFLEKCPNVAFDLTPGMEMYFDFSKNTDKWRDFFIKYQDRILFGTDNDGPDDPIETVNIIRTFLETDKHLKFEWWNKNETIRGVSLDKEVLEKIYYKNFQKYSGKVPKKLNFDLAQDELECVIKIAENSRYKEDIKEKAYTIMEKIKLLRVT